MNASKKTNSKRYNTILGICTGGAWKLLETRPAARLTKMLDVRPSLDTKEKLDEAEENLNQRRQAGCMGLGGSSVVQ